MILVGRRRDQAVAAGDFFLGQRDAQHGRLARLDQAGIAEEEGFVGDDLRRFPDP
jgi:hypothetical protein